MLDFRSLTPWTARNVSSPRENYSDPIGAFRRDIDRVFESFLSGFGGPLASEGDWSAVTPQIDLNENDKPVMITAELPGVSEKDIDVTVSGDLITIRGEKKVEEERQEGPTTYTERRYGAFSRSLRLPFEVADEKVEASCEKGVLTVTIPKPDDAQRPVQRIEVKSKGWNS